ncbi:MAG: AAA family ATPase [Candidatus Aenigmarchaeota archaeon]|nr:AAA family ATPase [Candidatus Aenigmarchaeota archaeon]
MIVVIVGKPSSGKTTAANALKKLGFSVVSTGDIIREEIKRRGLPYTKETDAEIGEWFHRGREGLIVQRLLDKVSGDKIVIEGLRDPLQLKELERRTGEKPILIAIEAPFNVRLEREIKRGRFPGETEKYLREREERESRHGEDKLIDMADYVVKNDGVSLKEFEKNVRDLVKKLMIVRGII